MSEREKAVQLLDTVPDYKIGYVVAYLQGLAEGEEIPNDETIADWQYQNQSSNQPFSLVFSLIGLKQGKVFNYRVSEIREEITPENRICTLEQAEVYVNAMENFMENMKSTESTRNNRPVYRTHNEEYVKGR